MPGETQPETTRVKKGARPWSGFFLGLILGLAVAIMLQQAGIWPADRLLVFGTAGVFALIGILMSGAGRQRVGPVASILPLILAIAMIIYGATGLADINETGNINGGCMAAARSSVDETDVFDTSAQDPFDIDPDGSLEWVATSPGPIMEHHWAVFVEFAGFDIEIDSGSHPNAGGSEISAGQVDDLHGYIETVTNISGRPLLGTFVVSGEIAAASGVVCDGFAFVRLISDPFESLVSQIALVVALLALIALLMLAFNRNRDAEVVTDEGTAGETAATADPASVDDSAGPPVEAAGAAGTAGTAGAMATGEPDPEDEPVSPAEPADGQTEDPAPEATEADATPEPDGQDDEGNDVS